MTDKPPGPGTSLTPTKDQAAQYALMLQAGMPASEAIRYFLAEDLDPAQVSRLLDGWGRSEELQRQILALQGKPWQGMTAMERIEFSINKHYNELAYYLYSTNYAELQGQERQKADKCREVLEAKLAGTSGKLTAVESFYNDIITGKLRLPQGRSAGSTVGSVVAPQ